MYIIGADGLTKCEALDNLQVGVAYPIDYSDSVIYITKITEGKVSYKHVPARPSSHEITEDDTVVGIMIRTGVERKLKQYIEYAKTDYAADWVKDEIKRLTDITNGAIVETKDIKEHYTYDCETICPSLPEGCKDAWQYIDNLTGGCCNGSTIKPNKDGHIVYQLTAFGNTDLFRLINDDHLIITKVNVRDEEI